MKIECGGTEHIYSEYIYLYWLYRHFYSSYLIRAIDVLANHIMQECLEEGKSWHWSLFALFLFALVVQYMAFLHTG